MTVVIAIFAALFGGCFGLMMAKHYELRVAAYDTFISAFSNCTNRAAIIDDKENKERSIRMQKYCAAESIMMLHGSDRIVRFIERLRTVSNLEEERPLFLDTSNFDDWSNKIDWASHYFSIANYKELCKIANEDLRSLDFKIGVL